MKKWVIGLGAVLLVGGLVVSAVAGPGWHRGWGTHMMGPGYGGHMMGYGPGGGGPGYCWNRPQWKTPTPEQTQKLDALRQKYWEETRALREGLFAKRQELWHLYGQQNPDRETIDKLEKEVFDLEQKLQEKAFAFDKEATEIAPEFGAPYGPGWGRHHMGPRWGRHMMGPYAGRPCWGY